MQRAQGRGCAIGNAGVRARVDDGEGEAEGAIAS